MKVALVTDRIGVVDTFSIPILSATAKRAGHEVTLIEYGRGAKVAVKKAQAFEPDILAFSVMSPDANKFLDANRVLKKATGAYSVFGGVHPTFFTDYIHEDGVDSICVGEGDIAFTDFLNNFATDAMYETTNMHFKVNGEIITNSLTRLVEDLDELPFPDKEIIYGASFFLRHLPVRVFTSSRGCPYKCTYCFNHVFNEMYSGKGKVVRLKSVDYFLDEIKHTLEKYPARFIKFHDDIFGIKRPWLEEFAERYSREINLPFLCYVRPNVVTESYVKLLKKAGCFSVAIAIEAGNEAIRNVVMQRKMSTESILNCFDILNRHGIRTYSLNILGLPTETEDNFVETIRINQDCKVDYADASIFQPYPGTAITKYCKDNDCLDEDKETWGGQYSKSVLKFPEKTKRRLHAYQIVFPLIVDMPWLEKYIGLIENINETSIGNKLLGMVYRFTYGYILQKRIYPVPIPLYLKVFAAFRLIFSRHRN